MAGGDPNDEPEVLHRLRRQCGRVEHLLGWRELHALLNYVDAIKSRPAISSPPDARWLNLCELCGWSGAAASCPNCNGDRGLVGFVRAGSPTVEPSEPPRRLAVELALGKAFLQLETKLAEAKKEIETDDILLADRKRLLDLFECEAHGTGCTPHAIEEVARLRGVESRAPAARTLYIHDLTADLRTLVDRHELAVSHPRVPPSETATRELEHARAALKNAEQLRGLRFDRVMAGEDKL